jgi:hypothetical protein
VSITAVVAVLYLALLIAAGFFDRYLILLVPLALVLGASGTAHEGARRGPFSVGLGLAALYAVFSVAATHDYFAWNRARWTALHDLEREGVPASAIDGGYEWNGVFRYDPTAPWWWAGEEEYVVAFGSAPGYREVARYPYRRLLPPGEASVLVLRRATAPVG